MLEVIFMLLIKWDELLTVKLFRLFLSCLSHQHRARGAPGSPYLSVRGHEGWDDHPHQHRGQSRRRPRRHVQGLVRTPVQLDSESHQLAPAAGHECVVSVCKWWAFVCMSTAPLLSNCFVSAKLWWPLWKSAEVDANMKRRISMGKRKTSKRRAKKKKVLINFWYRVACRENNVQMIKKTSERLQRGFSLIQKNSFINMSVDCQGVVSQRWSQSSRLHSSHLCRFLIAINNLVALAKGDLCILWVMTDHESSGSKRWISNVGS